MKIRVMVTGRSYHMTEGLPEEITLPDGGTVDDAIAALSAQLADGVEFPSSCLVAVSGEHLGTVASHETRALSDGDELTLISPVAGG